MQLCSAKNVVHACTTKWATVFCKDFISFAIVVRAWQSHEQKFQYPTNSL